MPRQKKVAAFTPYYTEEQAAQVRAAFVEAGKPAEGDASLSDFIVRATMREVKRLQRKHNNGKPWDPVPAGTARPGRRTRAETAASEDRV